VHPDRGGRAGDGDAGVVIIEFCLVFGVLLTLLFGIVDFGWAFYQKVDVRHGAREAARLVAVNYKPTTNTGTAQSDEIIVEACSRMDAGSDITVAMTLDATDSVPADAGSKAQVVVTKSDIDQVTGFFAFILDGVEASSTVSIRLEVDVTWANRTLACP
jgi:Flp pilus assembly protein TadG